MKFWRSIRDKIARSEIRKGAVEVSTRKTMGSQQAAAEDGHRRRGSSERRKQRRDNQGCATVDREAETAMSLDDELSTVSREATTVCRPHVLSLFFNSKILEPAVKDKLPLGRIARRSTGESGFATVPAIKLGRGIGMDVLLNDVHIPRTFAEVWCTQAEGGSEARWFIKNLSDKKPVRILYSDGSKKVLKQNEQGEVADSSELRLDTLKFTAKIEEGDMGEEYDFQLEFLPLETDNSMTSSGSPSVPRQNSSDSGSSLSSARGLCRQRGGSQRETELHVGECVTTQKLPGMPLPGLTNSHVIRDYNDPGAAAVHYHNQPCSSQGQMVLQMQGDPAQPHPQYFSAPRQPLICSQAHYLPNHYPDCAPILHPHNLPGNPPCMLGSSGAAQGPQPNMMNSTWPPGAMRGAPAPFSQVQSSGPAQGVFQHPGFPASPSQRPWNPLGTLTNNQPAPGHQMQFFPQNIQPGVADYPSLGGGTLYASFSQPRELQPAQGHSQNPNKPQPLHGPVSMQPMHQVIYNQTMTHQPEQQLGATFGHLTYVTQPESALINDSHDQWHSHLPRGIITTPTTHDQNPQLYTSGTAPAQMQTDSQRLNPPVQVNSGSIQTITTAFNDLMTTSSYSLTSHAEMGSRAYYAGTPHPRYDSSLTPLFSAEAPTLTDYSLPMTGATAQMPSSPIISVSSLNLPAQNGNRVNLRMHEAIEATQPQSLMYSGASIPLDLLRAPEVSESSRPDMQQLRRQAAEDDERQPQEHEEHVPQDQL